MYWEELVEEREREKMKYNNKAQLVMRKSGECEREEIEEIYR